MARRKAYEIPITLARDRGNPCTNSAQLEYVSLCVTNRKHKIRGSSDSCKDAGMITLKLIKFSKLHH